MGDEKLLNSVYHEAGKHHPLNIKVGSRDFLALIKEAQYHPVKHRLEHVVFQAIRRDEKVEAEVPILLEGDPPALQAGLQVLHHLDQVQVSALPANLPDELVVDATVLAEIGDKIAVGDLKVPEGVEILTDADQSIAAVVEPKEQVTEEPEPAEGEEAAEGEEGAEAEAAEGEGGDEAKDAEAPSQDESKQG
jgi:large subunit ribosomal protein L25